MDTRKLQLYRERLLEFRSTIEDLHASRQDSSSTVELDQVRTGRLSRMDALQGQAMAKAGQVRSQLELRRIEVALKRIESGDFGYCGACEESISPARLNANPAVALCLYCASICKNSWSEMQRNSKRRRMSSNSADNFALTRRCTSVGTPSYHACAMPPAMHASVSASPPPSETAFRTASSQGVESRKATIALMHRTDDVAGNGAGHASSCHGVCQRMTRVLMKSSCQLNCCVIHSIVLNE